MVTSILGAVLVCDTTTGLHPSGLRSSRAVVRTHLAADVDVCVFVQQGSDDLDVASSDSSDQHGLPTLEGDREDTLDPHIPFEGVKGSDIRLSDGLLLGGLILD